jgi:hypothetical protein
MRKSVSAAQLAALRALREGKASTFALMAAAANLNMAIIRELAARRRGSG